MLVIWAPKWPFWGWCAIIALPACSGRPPCFSMKASLWGAHLMALPSISRCLGTANLRLPWGRHASGGSARLFASVQDIWVSLHFVCSRPTLLVTPLPTQSLETFPRPCRRRLKVLRPPRDPVVADSRSWDLLVTPSSLTQGHETSLRPRHRRLRVLRPSHDPVVADSRSWDLPATSSSTTQGHETFPWPCRRWLKVMRPSRDSVVADPRSWDLPATPSSPTQGPETFPRLRRRLHKVMRPSRRLPRCPL
jgi:hypothetical protein